MDDVFLTARISDSRSICISPLPATTYRETATGLGGEYGYFVYEIDNTRASIGIDVIAKAASLDAALRLYEIILAGATADAA
ncbi:MAG: hypothetical protein AB7Q23_14280 [Hyphomonadaceae bacterium]